MEWLFNINNSGIYLLVFLGILLIMLIWLFIYQEKYKPWKADYCRDKNLIMEKETFLINIFRWFV